jgi:acetyltransferase
LTIVTNAGGPGVLAADAILSAGGELTALAPQTIEKLNAFLPAHWSHGNPVDIIGDADPERYGRAVEIAAEDPGSNGLLAILAPQGIADPALVADKLTHLKKRAGKPLLASWMGGASVAAGDRILTRAGIPTFPYPDTAARLFERMWRRSDNLRALYETPSHVDGGPETGSALIETARQNGRTLLTEAESKAVLQHYGIPVVPARLAHDEDHAVALAEEIGYPVVLKLDSETIVHKAAAGGVHLDLRDADAVRTAFRALEGHATVQPFVRTLGGSFELILGCSVDPQFGPVILFGSGGRLVEIIRDRSLALPPLNTTLARRLIERTRIYRALAPGGVDLAELERILVRFSRFALAEPWIREIDINPLLAGREQIVGLDARIVLHGPEVKREQIPRPAIRPYPREYAGAWSLRDGSTVMIRPVAPEDEPLMVEFHRHLSERSVYLRYFQMLPLHRRIDHERLTRICFNDYDHEIAIVAERTEPREILGVGRLTRDRNRNSAEFAALVADRCQGQGLGRELVRRLLSIAADEGIRVVHGQVLGENRAMMKICQSLGFSLRSIGFNDPLEARIEIDGTHRDQP